MGVSCEETLIVGKLKKILLLFNEKSVIKFFSLHKICLCPITHFNDKEQSMSSSTFLFLYKKMII